MSSRLLVCIRLAIVLIAVFTPATAVFARAYSVIHAFQPPPREPSGKLLELADGYFLGTSLKGGAFDEGSIYLLYRRADGTWGTFVIHSFFGPEGTRPAAGIIRGSDGNFYGTATRGGALGEGTVFRMSASGRVTLLHSFSRHDGAVPSELLIEAPDGSLWSTTFEGGEPGPGSGAGTIFRVTKEGSLTTMHRFNVDNGQYPNALVDGGDGSYYGTTLFGGGDPAASFRSGTFFKISLTGALTTLYSFASYGSPGDVIVGADGHLYGALMDGAVPPFTPGDDGVGSVFRATRAGAVTAVHNFSFSDGFYRPIGGVVQGHDGALYGATTAGGSSRGVMYRLTLDGAIGKLADLGGPLGYEPSGLTVTSDGRIVATTRVGGISGSDLGFGVAFTVSASAPAAVMYSFSPPTPLVPTGRLTEGPDGTLYGTSCRGGVYDFGTVFSFRAGVVETLHSFGYVDGACPVGGVTFGPDGMLYGTTFAGPGNPFGSGTVFRMSTSPGTLTTLWVATGGGSGSHPMSSPVLGADGNMYVTASSLLGGFSSAPDYGSVLRVTPADGAVTVVATFNVGDPWGLVPIGPLLLASDGQWYGTTTFLEQSGVYRMSPGGTLSSVAAMSPPGESRVIRWGLVEDATGRLLGVESNGGAAGLGSVFAVSRATGAVTRVHDFSIAHGMQPTGELVADGAGRFIGVTHGSQDIAAGQYGTIYSVTVAGAFTTLHRFSWRDGANPWSGVFRSADGSLYGTTQSGGFGGGVIFRLTP